jgi:hypothetical protein
MTWEGEPFEWTQLEAVVAVVTAVIGVLGLIVGAATALATLSAVAAALWVAHRERQDRRAADARSAVLEARDREREQRELERLRAIEEREVRAQAARVVVYTEADTRPFDGFVVNNASDLPVFAAMVHTMVPYTNDLMTVGTSEAADVIGPGKSKSFVISQWDLMLQGISTFAVTFRDANDVAWLRTGKGLLERLPEDGVEAEERLDARLRTQWTDRAATEAQTRWTHPSEESAD